MPRRGRAASVVAAIVALLLGQSEAAAVVAVDRINDNLVRNPGLELATDGVALYWQPFVFSITFATKSRPKSGSYSMVSAGSLVAARALR